MEPPPRPMVLPGHGEKREVLHGLKSANKRARPLSAQSTQVQLQEKQSLRERIESLAETLEQAKAHIRQKSLSTTHPVIPSETPSPANAKLDANRTGPEAYAANYVKWPSFSSKPAYKNPFVFTASASQDGLSPTSRGEFESIAYSALAYQPVHHEQRFQRSDSRARLATLFPTPHPIRRQSTRHYNSHKGLVGLGFHQAPKSRARAVSNVSGTSGKSRSTDRRRRLNELQPGTIISAPHHTQARSEIISTKTRHMSFSEFGAIHSKYRKMIILETWGEHCICLPLYSYCGKGLDGRRDIAEEYISVRDDSKAFWDREESSAGFLTAVRDPSWPRSRMFITGRTVVKLTEKIVHSYSDNCSVEGHLYQDDFRKLYKTYMETVRRKENEILGLIPGPTQDEEKLEEGEIFG